MSETLIITRQDICRIMAPADYLAAAEQAFRAAALDKDGAPNPLHLPMKRGSFHAKGATISLDRDYVAVKVNGNFPANPSELGLPTIQGGIILSDGSDGRLLAFIDSIEVTLRRTAAASALAARLLARADSQVMLICGCGEQGRAHAEALNEIRPITRCLTWDRDPRAARSLAARLSARGIEAVVATDLRPAARAADVIATCTSASEPFLELDMVSAGTFIAAVGADSPAKSEIGPGLMAKSRVVVDLEAQCVAMGDTRHAISAGAMSKADIHGELGQLLAGTLPGRRSPSEIFIFDSTGTGFQDVATAAAIYERCVERGLGWPIAMA